MEDSLRSSEEMEPSSAQDQSLHRIVLADITIPADQFLGNEDLQEVECAEGVCSIGDRAFKRCASLRDVSLPSTLVTLGSTAFGLCQSLVSVSFAEPKAGCGGLVTVTMAAFFGCSSLYRINIPSTVETIESCAFEACSSLTELHLHSHGSLQNIGERAFEGCQSLQEIHIPKTVKGIHERAFKGCSSLMQLTLPDEGQLLKIGERTLEECKSLEHISIPSTVTTIAPRLFIQCTSLVDVTLQEGLKMLTSFVFKSCSSLRRIKIPSTVEIIGYSCFDRCTALRDVQFSTGSGLNALGIFAFANCRSLCSISIPPSVETIGELAFSECSKLVTVEFSVESKATISQFAFRDCESLSNIRIPASINNDVEASVFDGCRRLHDGFRGREIAKATGVRFHQYPIHAKCYHASQTTASELQATIETSSVGDNSLLGHDNCQQLVDNFGMTPFHLLLSSAKPRSDLLEVLLNNCPSYILGLKDNSGKRAADYLLGSDWNEFTKSLLRLAMTAWTTDRLQLWGLEDWKLEMSQRLDELLNEQHQGPRERRLQSIGALMERYERFEATLLLELWLWKMKIKSSLQEIEQSGGSHRSDCRFQCGATFIVPVVFGWLDKLPEGQ